MKGSLFVTAVFRPRFMRFCRSSSDKWVIWRRAADKAAAEAAARPEKMKSTARCSSGQPLPSELLVVLVEARGRQRWRSCTIAFALPYDRLRVPVSCTSPWLCRCGRVYKTLKNTTPTPAGTTRPAPSALVSMFVLVLTGRQRAPERARPERSARRVLPLLATGLAQLAR